MKPLGGPPSLALLPSRPAVCLGEREEQKRFTWMMFDLFQLLVSCVTGIVKGLMRFVMVTVVNILSLPRMDISIFPAWVDYYLMLDTGAKSYFGMVLMYHAHNNPLMRVFCWIVEEDARKRKAGEAGMCSPGYRKASNWFNKLWMMHKNRTLAQYTASGGQGVPQSIITKAAKKKTPEEGKEFIRVELKKLSEGGGTQKGGYVWFVCGVDGGGGSAPPDGALWRAVSSPPPHQRGTADASRFTLFMLFLYENTGGVTAC